MKQPSLFNIHPRILVFLEVAILILATATAAYLWTAPQRQETKLSKASFNELLSLSKKETENPRVFYYLGLRLRELGHDGPARTAFERAAALDPDTEDIWLAWAATSARMTGDQEAFGILTMYTGAHPKSVRAHLALALLYQQMEAYKRAFELADKVRTLEPNNLAALRLVAATGLQLRKLPDAVAAARQATVIESNNWLNHKLLGEALEAEHKYKEALTAYNQAATLAPNEPQALLALGQLSLQEALDERAVQAALRPLEDASRLRPSWFLPHLARGRAYVRLKRWNEAENALKQAEILAPNDPKVAFALREWAIGAKRPAAAQEYSQRHVRLQATETERLRLHSAVWQKPDDPSVRMDYAQFLLKQGDYSSAAFHLLRLLELNPSTELAKQTHLELSLLQQMHPEVFRVRPLTLPMPADAQNQERPIADLLKDAEGMRKRGRFAEAQRVYETALQREPNSALAIEGLGMCLYEQNKSDEASALLQRALNLDQNRHEAAYTLAHIYFDAGFADEAARRMEKVVAQVSDNAEYWKALGLACVTVGAPDRLELARKAYRKASELDPKQPAHLRDLANVEKELQDFKLAELHYREALRQAPDDAVTLQLLGSFLAEHQPTPSRLNEANEFLQKADKAMPQNPIVQASLGSLRLTQGDAKGAVKYLEFALERNSGDTQAWYKLHRAYERLKNRERSAYCLKAFQSLKNLKARLSLAEESARMNLKDPKRRLNLARIYAESGQNAKAINQYQMTLKLDPKNTVARRELDTFTARLKATGQMPSMQAFEGMLIASINERNQERTRQPNIPPSPGSATQSLPGR